MAAMRKEARVVWVAEADRAYGHLLPDASTYSVHDHEVAVSGGAIIVRAIVPTAPSGTGFPVLVYMHGGGWVNGNILADEKKLILLAVRHGMTVVTVDYRLAPENPFPVPVDDCLAAVKWVASHTEWLSVDLRKGFLVMGSSAGGHLAAVIARRARDDAQLRSSPITGQILQVPVTCHPDAYPDRYKDQLLSFDSIVDAPKLSNKTMRWAWDKFQCDPHHLDASPLLGSFEGLPPIFVQVAGMDPLRDEGLLYEKLAQEAGIETKLCIYPGVPHSFETEYHSIQMAKQFNSDLNEGVQWLLHKQV
ncbi:hypothetical protein PENSPDRAFT_683003 [Peniophora sp. CONT]|nr:hypothetical protein PENSPDRAFT_683003 [Peniophora sp. CONT]